MRIGTPGFVAHRLTEAREARGLAQTALAELTGIKSQSISHYEQGRQSPSPEALSLLCEKLELPQRYFLHPFPNHSAEGVFFRAFRPAARGARLKAARRLNWLKEIAAYLGGHMDLPVSGVPVSAGDVEQAAEICRAALKIGAGPVSDVTLVLENLGCIVSRSNIDAEVEGSYSQWAYGTPFVMLAEGISPARLRFDAAHELGHLAMHRDFAPQQMADAETHRTMEAQADQFARAFLLPAKMFAQEVWAPTIDALVSLKKIWNCPVSEMILRCGEIGVFDKDQVRRALVNHARRGWKTREPHHPEVQAESPKLLARGIRLLIEEGGRHPHAVLTELGLAASDVEDLACLPRGYFAGCSVQNQTTLRLRGM
jgi:Zn-dependent peptidase ImmA (M78 family)/transcriptional regulator with XRE-family HTH domain